MGDQLTTPMPMPGNGPDAAASATLAPAASSSQQGIMAFIKLLSSMKEGGGLGNTPLTTPQTAIPTPQAPQEPVQAGSGQVPQGSFQTKGEAKRAEYSSMLGNIAEFTNKATAYVHEKKVRAMQMDVERVLTAFQGLQQAQSSGDQNAVKQNQQVLNDIFSDPKKVKSFEKAFAVKLMGDDKGKATPEHQGLQKALTEFKKNGSQGLNPVASKFQQSFPTVQGMNPQLAAMAQLIKAKILPEANEQLKAQTDTTKQISDLMKAGFTNESKEKIAGMLVDAKDRATQGTILKSIIQEHGRMGAAEIIGRAGVKKANITASAMIDSAQWRIAGQLGAAQIKAMGTQAKTAAASKAMDHLSKEHQRITDEVKDIQKELAGLSDSWQTVRGIMGANNKIKEDQKKLEDLRKQQDNIIQQMGNLTGSLGGIDNDTNTDDSGESKDFDSFFSKFESDLLGDESSSGDQ